MPATAHPQDHHFARNVTGICGVELLWGLGMPVLIESTFLQVFLRNLGASSFLVGLIPTLMSAGTAVFSLISYTLTARLARKRGAVVAAHVAAAAPILAFGILLGASGIRSNTLSLFLAAYSLFAIGIGLILPAWQNYLVKIFSEERSIRALALMMISQSAAKLAGSLWLVHVVERYSFSAAGSSLVFTLVGLVFLAGSFSFLLTVEEPEPLAPQAGRLRLSSLRSHAGGNRGFLLLLGTDLEYFALGGVIAFYANFATEYCGIAPALASGLFVAFAYFGGILANSSAGLGQSPVGARQIPGHQAVGHGGDPPAGRPPRALGLLSGQPGVRRLQRDPADGVRPRGQTPVRRGRRHPVLRRVLHPFPALQHRPAPPERGLPGPLRPVGGLVLPRHVPRYGLLEPGGIVFHPAGALERVRPRPGAKKRSLSRGISRIAGAAILPNCKSQHILLHEPQMARVLCAFPGSPAVVSLNLGL